MRDLNTHFGGLTEGETLAYGSHKRSNRSFPMSILRSANREDKRSHGASQTGEESDVLTNTNGHSAVASREPKLASKDSMGSNDSQKMIIQKDVAYTVQYE